MNTENLSTLKIHKLTQAQYDRELAAGRIDPNALYLTPDEEIDLAPYATVEQLNGKADAVHTHAISDVANLQSTIDSTLASAKSYTDSAVSGKADASHNHDDRYYTESEVDTKLSAKADTSHNHDSAYDAKGAAADALASAKSYTDTKVSGLASTTVVDNKISSHNTSAEVHSDIRDLISALSTKVSNFLDVDDTTTDQLSEVLTLIENNKGTLDSLTSSKVNVSDIVDNLTTSNASKVLSAKQGVTLKVLIDALQEAVDGKAAATHSHAIADVTGLQTALDEKDTAIEAAMTAASNQDAVVLAEAQKYAKEYADSAVSGKADASHNHAISDITNLQTVLDEKATQASLNSHTGNTTVHVTAAERTAWNAIEDNANNYTDDKVATVNNALTAHTGNADIHFTAVERTKLSGISEGANKTVVDSALSSTSVNPVSNSVVTSALNTATEAIVANTQSISAHTTSIATLRADVDAIVEITSQEIRNLFSV